jgi:ABC-type antimicrobial peptide transport system permease subunit
LPFADIVSLGSVSLMLVLVVVGAAILTARRALRISPTIALRAE